MSRTATPKICCANSRLSFRSRMSRWTWRHFMVAPRMARADIIFRCRPRPSNSRNGCSLRMMRPNWRNHPRSLAWRKYADFSNWRTARIRQYEFLEGIDFIRSPELVSDNLNLRIDYCSVCERQAWRHTNAPAERDVFMEIFVGNLAYTATEQELRQMFEPYGVVERVNLIQDRETGRMRGFGFVTMPDTTEAQAAIAGLQGTDLGGRTLSVNEARPRAERQEPRRPRW